jgi:hypothetical protein
MTQLKNVEDIEREYQELRERLAASGLFTAPIDDLHAYLLRDLKVYPTEREALLERFREHLADLHRVLSPSPHAEQARANMRAAAVRRIARKRA